MSGRGKSAESLALIAASHRILAEMQPASVRAVCYRLFIEGLIPAMSRASTARVGVQLVYARENGLIPWAWIVDETRSAETIASWDNPDALIGAAVNQYRKDYWSAQPNRVEVWSEKGTIRGALAPVLKRFGVTFRVMHGYGSATAINDIAESTQGGKPLTVLYVGDWDPSGLQMSEVDLPERLNRYGGEATIKRIALRAEDTKAGLPSFEAATKAGDSRYRWFTRRYGDKCWELDALSPVVLRERVQRHIRALLDMDAWNNDIRIEKAETESMGKFLATWKGISDPGSKYSGGDRADARP